MNSNPLKLTPDLNLKSYFNFRRPESWLSTQIFCIFNYDCQYCLLVSIRVLLTLFLQSFSMGNIGIHAKPYLYTKMTKPNTHSALQNSFQRRTSDSSHGARRPTSNARIERFAVKRIAAWLRLLAWKWPMAWFHWKLQPLALAVLFGYYWISL